MGDDGFRCSRHWKLRSEAEKGAPAPLVAAARADDRAHGVGRSPAPLFVPRCRARDVRRSTESDDGQLQGGFGVLRFDEDTEGARPDRLADVRPQERDKRHTVEQNVDTALIVPSLDVLVPQMDNQLVEVCRHLDVHIPEQVIEVPKISSPSRHCRRRVRFAGQTAEQLVEVPTIISYSSLLQRTVEQNVDIPVLGRGGAPSVFKVFLPDRDQQHSLLLRNAVLSGLWSRSLILVCLVASFKIFAQSRFPQRLLRVLVNTLVNREGSFSDFSQSSKKSEVKSALGVGTECGLKSIHAERSSSGSERSASEPG